MRKYAKTWKTTVTLEFEVEADNENDAEAAVLDGLAHNPSGWRPSQYGDTRDGDIVDIATVLAK